MPTVGLFNKEGKKVGDFQLNENIFGIEINENPTPVEQIEW